MALLQQATGAQEPVRLFGVRLVGLTPETGHKLLLSLVFIVVVLALSWGIKQLVRLIARGHEHARAKFFVHQGISLLFVAILVIGLVSIWFEDPARLTTVLGVVTAGVAIALQRVITAFAAYLIILRGRIFSVGDRITMGGVRGDVVALGFMQTSVMEMGEPPAEQSAEPAMWVHARQYTGRLVRVTNDKIFDTPVYNYTRQFPYFWEEIQIPIAYRDDRKGVEGILLEVAERHTRRTVEQAKVALEELRRHYLLPGATDLEPKVYHRLTDNWVELTLRFVTPVHGVRVLKDAMSREILAALDQRKIGIASSTFEVVGLPPLRVVREDGSGDSPAPA